MSNGAERAPVVLAISGHDPTGAAGVHADVEAAARMGAACASLITATTAQNTESFEAVFSQPVDQFRRAAKCLLADMSFAACKVGLLGCAEIAHCVASLPVISSGIPVVIDPITHSGTGASLAGRELLEVMRDELVPLATVLTPNCREARDLSGIDDPDTAAQRLLEAGARYVLLTGADQDTVMVRNRLYGPDGKVTDYEFRRLPYTYHGSGCTLSAALAALLARGFEVSAAVEQAQAFTHEALLGARHLGRGQWHPLRAPATAQGD